MQDTPISYPYVGECLHEQVWTHKDSEKLLKDARERMAIAIGQALLANDMIVFESTKLADLVHVKATIRTNADQSGVL